MRNYPFYQIDAFTDRPLAGNPCAVLLDTDDLDVTTMQAVALEMNLSETAFLRRSTIADFGARYFTPSEEIPLAGHPTVASFFALALAGRLALSEERSTYTLELRDGPIPVEVHAQDGAVRQITMTQRRPRFLGRYRPEDVLPLFGLTPTDALPGAPLQTVSTGTPQLMVPVKDLAALRRARLQIEAYDRFRAEADFFSPHLFCLQGATPAGHTFARHFGSPPDTLEDPFTGSATGGMAAYLWRYGLIGEPSFTAEQGHWMGRPGQAYVEVVGAPEDITRVRVGGQAVLVLEGQIFLPG